MILSGRKTIDDVLCKESEASFNSEEWMELMEAGDGVNFEYKEKVEWVMAAVLRGVKDAYAASLYQTLVSSILLRPPTDVNASLLPATSHVRVQVEQTRLELLRWVGRRWLGIRQERGFHALEGWALKDISERAAARAERVNKLVENRTSLQNRLQVPMILTYR